MAVTDHPRRASSTSNPRRIAALAAGDIVAFHIITAIGLLSHSELNNLSALPTVAEIAMPFAIGWFIVAPFIGAFRDDVAHQPRRMLACTSLAWLIALPIGLLLWSLIRQKQVQPAFAVVTFITNLVALIGWRGTYALLALRRHE
jgi:hypothetical protein